MTYMVSLTHRLLSKNPSLPALAICFFSLLFHKLTRYFFSKPWNQNKALKIQFPHFRVRANSVSIWVPLLTRLRSRLIAYSWLHTHSQGSKLPSAIFTRPRNERRRLGGIGDACEGVGKRNLLSVLCWIVLWQKRPLEREGTVQEQSASPVNILDRWDCCTENQSCQKCFCIVFAHLVKWFSLYWHFLK